MTVFFFVTAVVGYFAVGLTLAVLYALLDDDPDTIEAALIIWLWVPLLVVLIIAIPFYLIARLSGFITNTIRKRRGLDPEGPRYRDS